jgi:hypothetical protein
MNDDVLLERIDSARNYLVSVSTGVMRINEVNERYQREYSELDLELRRRGLENPIPYADLWEWHERWSSGDLPTYRSRRQFITEMVGPLHERVRELIAGNPAPTPELTGWPRVDRNVGEMRLRLAEAKTEEQFQTVGLLCREALISLSDVIWARDRHPPLDGIEPSNSDAGRKLEAYLAVELEGGPNEEARRHAKAALKLALALQHRRTAEFREAAMCVEGTTAMISVIAIASGRRDPD